MQDRDLRAVSPALTRKALALSEQSLFHFKGDWDNLQMI